MAQILGSRGGVVEYSEDEKRAIRKALKKSEDDSILDLSKKH